MLKSSVSQEEQRSRKLYAQKKIAEVIADTLGCKTSSVSVAIKDVKEEDWKEKVWDASIVPDK